MENNNYVPEIYIENGNWFINGVDTGVKAQGDPGKDGITPQISEDGYWCIGDVKTPVRAKGYDGYTPYINGDGYWCTGEVCSSVKALGEKGDKGDDGAQGPQGATGEPGTNGKDGVDGAKGDKGPKGDKGEIGPAGPQGIKGDKGATGPQGPAGPVLDIKTGMGNAVTTYCTAKPYYKKWGKLVTFTGQGEIHLAKLPTTNTSVAIATGLPKTDSNIVCAAQIMNSRANGLLVMLNPSGEVIVNKSANPGQTDTSWIVYHGAYITTE